MKFLFPIIISFFSLLEASTEKFIENKFPGGRILQQTPCLLGEAKLESQGLLIQLKQASSPLVAAVMTYAKGEWSYSQLPQDLSYSKGSIKNFLRDFWVPKKGFAGPYEIRCTSPNQDKDILLSANGEFSNNFKRENKSVKHLCFQISATYNSWSCYGVKSSTHVVEPSYMQMNSD